MERDNSESAGQTVRSEVRTQRLVIVDVGGIEHAVIEVTNSVVECRLGGRRSGMPCEVLVSVGEHEQGLFVASVELWANGNNAGGASVIVQGSRVEFTRAP